MDKEEIKEAQVILDERLLAEEAEDICRWAAARAGVIVVAPLVGSMTLMVNEIYMIIRLGKVYGEDISEGAAAGILGSLGAYFVGSTLTTLIPFPPLQVPVAVGTTYALGRVVTKWLQDGKPDNMEQFKQLYSQSLEEAKANLAAFKNNPHREEPLGDEKKEYRG